MTQPATAHVASRPRRTSSRLQLLDAVAAADLPFVKHQIAGRDIVFVNEPELIQQILVTHAAWFEKSEFQNRVMGLAEGSGTGLGNGLLTSSNADHRRQHRLIGRLFSKRALDRYVASMAAAARETRERWADGARLDIGTELMRISARIVASTMFSWELTASDERVVGDLDLIGTLLGRSARQRDAGWQDPSIVEKAAEYIEARLLQLVEERRRRTPPAEDGDLIDVLLQAQAEDIASGREHGFVVTDRQIRDELMTMFITGAENPRNALTWTFYVLARHPDVARAVQRELADARVSEQEVTLELLERLPYTLQVFKEVLRLYPPGYAFGRRVAEALTLGPLQLERDAEVVISPYALHRRASLFERPTEFLPDRFAGNADSQMRYTFLPFGAGPRGCIGGRFSMLEAHVVLAVLLAGVRLTGLNEDVVLPEPRMTLRPGAPVHILVKNEATRG